MDRPADGVRDCDVLVAKAGIEIMAVDVEQANITRIADQSIWQGAGTAKCSQFTVAQGWVPRSCVKIARPKAYRCRFIGRAQEFSRITDDPIQADSGVAI